ncbi:SigE family RNA polymerase sigma factor [Actinomadura macra]|uniref:SigE family RNA polymerase sigma factor n=1 Tax=Actinomadura macra TaxID=46164 RepID=UPI00082E5421|nr:SigE family RNA polymerase sigma factor [Actinomadura macra]
MTSQHDSGFVEYVEEARTELRRRAFLLCGDWFEADDLTQKTLMNLLRRWPHLDHDGELGSYTRTVLVHTFVSERRRARWSREIPSDHSPEAPSSADDQQQLENRIVLLDALSSLGDRQRAVIVLRYLEDLTVGEAADALGCSQSTVRSQTTRGLAALRKRLWPDQHRQGGGTRGRTSGAGGR